mgnify:CR=1 FL=1|tara:strand:+ start:1921 stop:2664 length:744 start_codon:yes stop_codon:yes gene_type:complete
MLRTYSASDFTDLYLEVVNDCYYNPDFISAPRELKTNEILNACVEYTNPEAGAVIDFKRTGMPSRQEVYDKYRAKELAWYLSGSLQVKAIGGFWKGIANHAGNVVSNYGFIVLYDKKYNWQNSGELITGFEHVVRTLTDSQDSRRAVLHYNEPRHYAAFPAVDIPCSVIDQFFIRDNTIYMTHVMRSQDLGKGYTYDCPWACNLLKLVKAELEKRLNKSLDFGSVTFFDSSLHFYHTDSTIKNILGL